MRTIRSTRFHGLLAALALLCATAEQTRAQIPVGPQFQVNTYTPFLKQSPDVAAAATGAFVVVWDSGGSAGSDDSGYSVQGQRYDAAGSPVAGGVPDQHAHDWFSVPGAGGGRSVRQFRSRVDE
jgi:hypothetical protein